MKLSARVPRMAGLFRLLRPHRGRIATLGLTSLSAGALEAIFLLISTRAALSIVNDDDTVHVIGAIEIPVFTALGVAAVAIAVRLLASIATLLLSTSLEMQIAVSTRERLAESFLSSSWSVQQSEPDGQFQQLQLGFTQQVINLTRTAGLALTATLTLLALLGSALIVDALPALVVLLSLVVLGVVLSPLRVRLKTRAEAAAAEELSFANTTSEVGSLGLEIRAFGVENKLLERLRPLISREALARRRVELLSQSTVPAYVTFAYAAAVAGLAIIASLEVSKLGSTGAVVLIVVRSLAYGQQLQLAMAVLVEKSPFLQFLEQTRLRYIASRPDVGRVQITNVDSIEFKDLSFAYRKDEPVLKGISFSIGANEIVGVVGPSGSGKSTLVELLLGLREPTSGLILINGHDLASLTHDSWSTITALVPQETTLLTGTVSENIRFFRQGLTDEEVTRAALQASVDKDIRLLPDGYNAWVGERGSQLSGGQRQRLAIARALVSSPRLLILDEPTSALDGQSESMIRETLASLSGKTTVIVVAHRISTLSICDRVLVLQDGKIVVFDETSRVLNQELGYSEILTRSELS